MTTALHFNGTTKGSGHIIHLTAPHLISTNLIHPILVEATANCGVVRCEAIQFAVAATNHVNAFSSNQMRSGEMRSDEMRRDG